MGHLAGSQSDFASSSRWGFKAKLPPARVVEAFKTRIIPKLALVFGASTLTQPASPLGFDRIDVQQFVEQLTQEDESKVFAQIEALVADGWSAEKIYGDLLTPAAQKLRNMWEVDSTDFAHVALGIGRIQNIIFRLGQPS